ncbi:MAG TPA: hypothetical protein VF128_04205 [Gemmatimonadaceae bacterium]
MRLLLVALLVLAGCEPTGVEDVETVALTLRLKLAGDRGVGATPARIHVYAESVAVPRAQAFPDFGDECVFATTPVTVCTFDVPRSRTVTLIAAEPDPAVVVRFAAESPTDTARDGRYVEFTGWSECADAAERGMCVIRPKADLTMEANFQLLQQISVYQTGAARMDYITFPPAPTLKVPAENDNILDYAGCRRLFEYGPPCDSVRAVGDAPFHRITAFVPRKTIFAMFPNPGAATEFARWDGACIPSAIYPPGTCSVISPDTSGPPIRLTVRYSWWSCPSGPSDRNTGGCVLQEVISPRRSGQRE